MANHDLSGFGALLACLVLAAAVWVVTVVLVERRKIKLEEMADRLGMTICKSRRRGLPGDLSLSGTKFAYFTKLHSVFMRECGGCTVAFFDCQVGSGRGMWIKTVIAVRSELDVTGLEELGSRLVAQRLGPWVVIYRRWSLNLTGYRWIGTEQLERLLRHVCADVGGSDANAMADPRA